MAYGTPASFDQVEQFYTDIRHNHPPSAEQLADLQRRYRAIGGLSPLDERTKAQLAALANALQKTAPGKFITWLGTKHAEPKIEDAINSARLAGATEIVGIVLAPHYSDLSVGQYIARAKAKADELSMASTFVTSWHDDPTLIELLATRTQSAIESLALHGQNDAARIEVVFSAHSLPKRILGTGDPYCEQLSETAQLVANQLELDNRAIRWRTGWQSAGRTAEPWIGPDILQILGELAESGITHVVVCPAGFTSDHLEVLYDLDIEAAAYAKTLGIGFVRTKSLNDDPQLGMALARQVIAASARKGL